MQAIIYGGDMGKKIKMTQKEYQYELQEREKRQKELEEKIHKSIELTVEHFRYSNPKIISRTFFGAVGIFPSSGAIIYIFKNNNDMEEAKINGLTNNVINFTRNQLELNNYPEKAIKGLNIGFVSEEDCILKSNGNWFQYFK